MTTMKLFLDKLAAALTLTLLLTACGGGGGGVDGSASPSVSNMGASSVAYSKTMSVTVSGNSLTNGNVQMIVEGPCGPVTKVSGGTDLTQVYTCTVTGVGALYPRIRTADGLELASMHLTVPAPQVSVTVSQGTRSGTFVVELDLNAAPLTVNNFLAYVNQGFYNSTLFHRVIPAFVVQAGGYTAGSAGPNPKTPTRAAIALESNNGLTSLRGTIAMARTSEPNSATAQFYVNLVDNPDLDYQSADKPGYAVFGKVISGLDVVDEIGKVPTTLNASLGLADLPVNNVTIVSATQSR